MEAIFDRVFIFGAKLELHSGYASEPSYQPEAWNRARWREAWQKMTKNSLIWEKNSLILLAANLPSFEELLHVFDVRSKCNAS